MRVLPAADKVKPESETITEYIDIVFSSKRRQPGAGLEGFS